MFITAAGFRNSIRVLVIAREGVHNSSVALVIARVFVVAVGCQKLAVGCS